MKLKKNEEEVMNIYMRERERERNIVNISLTAWLVTILKRLKLLIKCLI